jgi:glycosyltransferase involved in cell wall biosynthesis
VKILVINWQDIKHPLGGGAEVHLHEIFKRIAARGHSVTLFCSVFGDAPREENIDGIRVLRSGGRHLFNFRVPMRYWMEFQHSGFDVVVDDMNKIPFFTPFFVKEPLVGIVHHLFGRSIFTEAPLPVALYVFAAERFALPFYRNFPTAVVSESTKQELMHYGYQEASLSIVQNAVNQELYRPLDVDLSPDLHIGYLGRLKKYKSIDHLLMAFQIVKKELPNAKLTILGDGDARPSLEKLAVELGIAQSVTFAGYVAPEEKVRLLGQMRVVVNTSAKEGWGLTVIEANACGIPVVASDVPGLRDSVVDERTGFLYEYGNIEQLAQKIMLVLRDDNLRDRLSREALAWGRSFSWDVSADRMLKVLEEAVEQRKSSRH